MEGCYWYINSDLQLTRRRLTNYDSVAYTPHGFLILLKFAFRIHTQLLT